MSALWPSTASKTCLASVVFGSFGGDDVSPCTFGCAVFALDLDMLLLRMLLTARVFVVLAVCCCSSLFSVFFMLAMLLALDHLSAVCAWDVEGRRLGRGLVVNGPLDTMDRKWAPPLEGEGGLRVLALRAG